MEYLKLGGKIEVSRLGFGGCPMGRHGWGEVSEKELVDAVSAAFDEGVNFFDTADIYGIGESEKILGRALRLHRNEAVIATKFGVRQDNQGRTFYDNSPAWISTALNACLKRLGTDYIDVFQVHYHDGKTPFNVIFAELEKHRRSGKLRFVGLSNIKYSDIENIKIPDFCISFQSEYSLAKRINEEEIKNIQKNTNLTFMSWGSLGQGVLSGKYDDKTDFPKNDRRRRAVYVNFHGKEFKKNMNIVRVMKEIAADTGKTLPQIALRWIMDYMQPSITLAGIKRTPQLVDNCGVSGWQLSNLQLKQLDKISKQTLIYTDR